MAAPSIGGSAFPTGLTASGAYGRGVYRFQGQEDRVSGDYTLYRHGEQRMTVTWAGMGTAEWAWLNARYHEEPTTFELYRDDTYQTEISFTSGAMLRPTYEDIKAYTYLKVKAEFVQLLPVQE